MNYGHYHESVLASLFINWETEELETDFRGDIKFLKDIYTNWTEKLTIRQISDSKVEVQWSITTDPLTWLETFSAVIEKDACPW